MLSYFNIDKMYCQRSYLQWSAGHSTLATLSEDGVTLLAEHPSSCHVSSTMVAIQSRPRKIDINFIAEKTTQESAFSGITLNSFLQPNFKSID